MNTGKLDPANLPSADVLCSLIDKRNVRSVFQPIVSLETAEVSGFEALARPGPDSGIKNASELFDLGELYNKLWDLEAVTRKTAFSAAEDFPNGILLFTNSSPDVFTDPRFVESVEALVRSIPGLTPSRVVLEITERAGGDNLNLIVEQVARLKAKGFQIAIDDVGAGTSGLTRIMVLRPHWLKLDRELVSGIDKNRYKLNLIRFMVHFARLSGVHVIAEGIERQEELAALISLGVKYVQGFYLAKPNAAYQQIAPDLAGWIRARWADCQAASGDDPRLTTLGLLASPVTAVQMTTPIKQLALDMLKSHTSLGVAVLDGTRLVGWCSKDQILENARKADSQLPIGFISSAELGTLPPTATIGEAFELLCSRQDANLADPVIISENDMIVGVVTLRRLLAASVGETRLWAGVSTTLTGLPGRVAADKRVKQLIAAKATDIDASIVDIRSFADYNGAFGYDMGDRLIQDLSALLRSHIAPADLNAYVAHLADDRFLVIGSKGTLEQRLREVINVFEQTVSATPAWMLTPGGTPDPDQTLSDHAHPSVHGQDCSRLGLRVMLMPGVFAEISSPRDLADIETRMRANLRLLTLKQPISACPRSIFTSTLELNVQTSRSAA